MMRHVKMVSVLFVIFVALPRLTQGQVRIEVWQGATLSDPQQLANAPDILGAPTGISSLGLFEAPLNTPGNFVARYMACFSAPKTGTYRFWVAANQKAKVWISADKPNFVGRTPLARVTLSPPPLSRQWTKYAQQRSAPMSLVRARKYCLLAVHIESDSNNINHMAVGWLMPGSVYERPMPGSRLTPWSYVPPMNMVFTANPLDISTANGSISLDWLIQNAASCVANSTPVDSSWSGPKSNTSGVQEVFPQQTVTYQLSCLPLNSSPSYTIGYTLTNSYNQQARIAWDPVTTNIDDTPLTNLGGYRIYFGSSPGIYLVSIDVGNQTSVTIAGDNFQNSGTYYFAVTAYTTTSLESSYSSEVSKLVWK